MAMIITLEKSDVVACHRVGPEKRGEPPTLIARFASRDLKVQIFMGKKTFESYVKVFINEDLTTLRFKLFHYIKSMDSVKSVTTRDGKMLCQTKNGRKEVVENPDDLFKLGVNNITYTDFGLFDME